MSKHQLHTPERAKRSSEVAIGVPIAFIAIGLALATTTVSYFLFGVVTATIGLIWLLIYWFTNYIHGIGALLSILAATALVIYHHKGRAPYDIIGRT